MENILKRWVPSRGTSAVIAAGVAIGSAATLAGWLFDSAILKAVLPGRQDPGSREENGPRQRTYFVRDNGLGIPAAYQAKVFQAFQRLHPSSAPGEGMGLTIVRRVVERHGGRIWLESNEGQGTTFFVSLPVAVSEKSETVWGAKAPESVPEHVGYGMGGYPREELCHAR